MKKENLNYTSQNLIQLLNYINKKNKIDIDLTLSSASCDEGFNSLVKKLQNKKKNKNYSTEILGIMSNILDNVKQDGEISNINRFQIEISKEIDILKNILVEKMQVLGDSKKIDGILNSLLEWNNVTYDITMSNTDRTNSIVCDFMKNNILFLINYLPHMVHNNADYRKNYEGKVSKIVPKHWNLSHRHQSEISDFIFKEFTFFTEFYDDELLDACMKSVISDSRTINDYVNNIPYYCQYIDNAGNVLERKIPSVVIKMIHYHSLLLVLILFVNSLEHIDQSLLNEMNKRGLDIKLRKIVSQSIQLLHNRKRILDMNQDDIKERVSKVKEKEKEQIKERLGNLSKEARKIEDTMKNLSLGDWAVGRTKAIYMYDKDQYDKERSEIEANAIREIQLGNVMDDVTDMHRDIYMMDHIEEQHRTRMIEQEENTIHMAEDDDYGENFDGDEYY